MKQIIFPHHLFHLAGKPLPSEIVIWEDPVLYGDRVGDVPSVRLEFNRLRLVYMRASVRCYASYLKSLGIKVTIVDIDKLWTESVASRQSMFKEHVKGSNVEVLDPMDKLVEQRYKHIGGTWIDTPMFILSNRDVKLWVDEKT